MAKGGASRPGKRGPVPLEIDVHLGVAQMLRLNCQRGWDWTHFPAGEQRTGIAGEKLMRMGLKRGWADFLLVSPFGQLHCLEIKRPVGASMSVEQKAFAQSCREKRVPHAIVRSVDEAIVVLMRWGVLKRAMRIAA